MHDIVGVTLDKRANLAAQVGDALDTKDRGVVGRLEILRYNLVELKIRLVFLVSTVVLHEHLGECSHGAEVALATCCGNVLLYRLVDFPAHELLGSLLQVAEQNLDEMQIFVGKRARHLEDTVKDIHSHYLDQHYSPPSLDGVECIGIDEFAVKKGHVYKTIVVDLISGRILYVGEGKGVDALEGFWKKVRRKNVSIKYVATDLSAAFIASVLENCPGAIHVFDHFHVVKLMNDKLDDIRRMQYSMEKDINKRRVLKGTRYLLLGNGADIYDDKYKTRLENALAMNEPLSKAYYLKEQLREIWAQANKGDAEKVLMDWVEQAKNSKIHQLQKMAMTMMAYKRGILAWYDCHISTGKVEGINNKIKVMKRNAYGFRDERYFKLRLYALHDCRITRNVG